MAGRVRTKVSLVIVLIDDFNNKVIAGSKARVWIPGEKAPILKTEGYYVFTNLSQVQFQVLIESGMYENQTVPVMLSEEDAGYTMIKARMVPNRAYLLPSGTTCVEGTAEPGSRIRLFCREGVKTLKLLYDYDCSGEYSRGIGIYHPDEMDIEGKVLYIENRDRSNQEFFRISKAEDGGRYLLSEPLVSNYKKIGTTIYPVYGANADEKGYFFLPVLNMNGDVREFFCEAVGTGTKARICRLIKGTVNKVNLLKEE